MNPDQSVIISRDFQSIFTGAVRYEIPFFQRGYAWTRDEWNNQRALPFARYVLEQLDQRLQAHGEMPDYTTINTIEHVMPQTLDEDWKPTTSTCPACAIPLATSASTASRPTAPTATSRLPPRKHSTPIPKVPLLLPS